MSFKLISYPTGWFFKQTKLSQKLINKPYSVPIKKQQLCSVKFPPSSSSANTSIMICPSLSLLKNRNDKHAVESFPLSSFAHKPSSIFPSRNCLIWQINSSIKESETYICDEWNNNPKEYFKEYVFAMHNIYLYAHKVGFEVVQVIPTFYDTVDETLFKILISSCCDEVSLMNYAKTVQVSSIEQEIELCRKSGKRVETIFETQPHSEEYSVSEKNSYFCDGLPVLESVRDKIFETYQYENLYASYHTFESIYYMVTGENID